MMGHCDGWMIYEDTEITKNDPWNDDKEVRRARC